MSTRKESQPHIIPHAQSLRLITPFLVIKLFSRYSHPQPGADEHQINFCRDADEPPLSRTSTREKRSAINVVGTCMVRFHHVSQFPELV